MKTKAVWYPPQQAPDPELAVFTTEFAEDTDRTGKILNKRYKLIRRIGAGATASVYEARHEKTGARLAVKVLRRDLYEPLRDFFGQEGRIAARHNCPHLIQAIDLGEVRGATYTVFNFAEGKPLRHLAGNSGPVSSTPLPWQRLCRIILQVLEALAVLHKSGIVHRDLHSSNILVDESRDDFTVVIDVGFAAVMLAGNSGPVSSTPLPWQRLCRIILQVLEALAVLHKSGIVHRDLHSSNILVDESRDDFTVVIDVGFAAVMPGRRITQAPEPTRTIYGMHSYVAPETLAGCPPDPRMDVYSVGVLMFELLTGLEMIDYGRSFGNLAVPPLRVLAPGYDIPEAVDAIVLRALSDVSVRFASAEEMAAAIRAALAEVEADAEAATRRRVLRPAAVIGAGGAIIGGLLVGGLLLATQPSTATLAAMNSEPPRRDLEVHPPASGPAQPVVPQPLAQEPELPPPAPPEEAPAASPPTPAPLEPSTASATMTSVNSQVVGQQARHRVQVTAEQRLIRKARRSILECNPDGVLANAAVVIKRLANGSVDATFNGRSVQGTFGRCVADYAKTAALGPDGVLKFLL
ncbi:serine/threonine-protein kinase [Nannocystis pusilla]|uniref:non-specific serine/threonine protein kinase n=1 Tax=Nannocystis pusilla TaxID=889268 RepID=A0ABS7U3N7_9BACT|nr:serine/threonine-protein kinase [Nannocystis pusilla]MBZ5714886.1 protein kinase [Nannocystis pusilla]